MAGELDGLLVRYEGRLDWEHGIYRASLCDCPRCRSHYRTCAHCSQGQHDACTDGGLLYLLTDPDDEHHQLAHPRRTSLTPVDEPAPTA